MDPDSSLSPAQAGFPGQPSPFGPAAIIVLDKGWHRVVPRAAQIAARAVAAAGGAGSVVLSSDRHVKQLNVRHRGRNKPTNVLTFDSGDIVLALGVVRREARAARRRAAHHLAHLVVHGALHLRGADHHLAGEARRMEMAETRVLHRLGVRNPWKGDLSRGERFYE